MEKLYYLQDSRTYTGNCVMWWKRNWEGYTSNIREAALFTEEMAKIQHDKRPSDIPWPVEYINNHTQLTVDMQKIKRSDVSKL